MAKRTAAARKEWYTIKEVAEQCLGVSTRSVYGWIDAGLLPAYRTPGGVHMRVKGSDLDKAMQRVAAGEAWVS